MKEWTPNSACGCHAFGFGSFSEFLLGHDKILPWIAKYSPCSLLAAGSPPAYLYYDAPPALGEKQKDPTHTAHFGVKLQKKLRLL